jgi:predicted ATPase
MKLEILNLGVIEKAEIDIKPLTLFVGPNNAGKTWLAYCDFAAYCGKN